MTMWSPVFEVNTSTGRWISILLILRDRVLNSSQLSELTVRVTLSLRVSSSSSYHRWLQDYNSLLVDHLPECSMQSDTVQISVALSKNHFLFISWCHRVPPVYNKTSPGLTFRWWLTFILLKFTDNLKIVNAPTDEMHLYSFTADHKQLAGHICWVSI